VAFEGYLLRPLENRKKVDRYLVADSSSIHRQLYQWLVAKSGDRVRRFS
jgi:hypothetical protein